MKKTSSGLLAFTIVGLYYLWRNRDQVQQFLDKTGVPINLDRVSKDISKSVDKIKSKISIEPSSIRKTG